MNLLTRVLHKVGQLRSVQSVASRLWPWIGSGVLGPVTESGVAVTPMSSMQSATVLACTRLISEAIAALPIHVYKRVDGVRQRAEDHPVQELISCSPNPDQTSFTCRDYLVSQLLLTGQAIALIERNPLTAYPISITPQQPGTIIVYRTQSGQTVYVGKDGNVYRPDQVIHLLAFTYDGYTGLGPIQLAAASIGLDLSMTRFGSRFFRGGYLAGVLEREGNLSKEAADEFKRQWREQFEGIDNSHGTPLLPQGVKYKPLTMTPEASQFLESRRYSREEICALFKVHPSMIGDTSKTSYNTLEMTNLQFVQITLLPWLRRIEEEFERKLFLTSEQSTYSIRFNVDGMLRADTSQRQAYYASGRQWGYLSVNDIRALENLPPIPGGDTYLQPVNMAPVGQQPAATSQVVQDAAARLLTKESKALHRAAKKYQDKPDEFKAWASSWYQRHAQLVASVLAAPAKAAGSTRDLAEYAADYCRAAEALALAAQLAGALDDLIDDLETLRPAQIAQDLLQESHV